MTLRIARERRMLMVGAVYTDREPKMWSLVQCDLRHVRVPHRDGIPNGAGT